MLVMLFSVQNRFWANGRSRLQDVEAREVRGLVTRLQLRTDQGIGFVFEADGVRTLLHGKDPLRLRKLS
jgi:hypothetical protein